jgi:TP901 family phage tail tape measure protein
MAGSAVVGTLKAILTLDTATFETTAKQVAQTAKTMSKEWGDFGRKASSLGASLTTNLTLPLAGLGAVAFKLGTDFESSFAGIAKTVDGVMDSAGELTEFGKQTQQAFRDLAKEIPVNVNELNKLGEAAGALGIPKAEIADFARVMAMLGVTTNVTAEQAAESIAKIQTIFGQSGQATENFASALVDLGNKGASTEQEILALASRVASAGNTVGLTQAQVLGFAAAIANVGMEAEAGGSAMSRVFIDISTAVSKGGDSLADFARVAKMSTTDFANLFRTDAASATQAFIEGLGQIKASGGDLNATLAELGFTEIRQSDLLRRLAGDTTNLSTALTNSEAAWQRNSALSEEAEKRFATTQSQLTLLWNRLQDVAITIGNAMAPAINILIGAADKLIPVIETVGNMFAALPAPVQAIIVGLGAVVAAVGPLLFVIGQLSLGISAVSAAFATGGIAMTAFGGILPTILTAIAGLASTLALPLAALAALGAAWYFWGDEITATAQAIYTAVKTWLWDNLEPVLTPIGGLLASIGEMFAALGQLVGAVAVAIAGKVGEIYTAVKTWLLDKMAPVFTAIEPLLQAVSDKFKAAKDAVSTIVQAFYAVVKTYLLDRFTDIVNGIKGKVEAVTGFFKNMYEQVVGNSFVPDMIEGIKREFARLPEVMEKPVQDATGRVQSYFSEMLDSVTGKIKSFGDSLSGLIESHIGGPLGKGLAGIAGNLVGGVTSLLTGGLSSLFHMAMPFVMAGMKKLGEVIWSGIKKFGSWIGGLFKGEGAKTNDVRDQIKEQLGGDASGAGLEERIGAHMGDPAVAAAYETFLSTGNRDELERAAEILADALGSEGFAKGTRGQFLDFGAGTWAPLHNDEAIVTRAEGPNLAQTIASYLPNYGGGGTAQFLFQVDGRTFMRAMAPYLPGEVQRLKLAP